MGSDAEDTNTQGVDSVDSGMALEKAAAANQAPKDVEATSVKHKYPVSVFFILICELCERFCYYGMRAVLTLYLTDKLNFNEHNATSIYHAFTAFAYFTPLLGAVLADSLLGKFRTIFYLSIVYCAGSVVLALAATPDLKLPGTAFSMIGLALIAIGTGGIKPCVSAFGGDQFVIPGQEKQLASFFAIFYFAINTGSLLSTTITPIFREDIKCFGDDTCFPLAFAVPAILMLLALTVFLIGRPMYRVNKPQGNMLVKVIGAIRHSLSRRKSEVAAGRVREHWIHYADDRYDMGFLEDARTVLKVLFLYIPLPVFWTLYDQQGSRWTLMATRMNGMTFGYSIKADQIQVVNPLLVLLFIPLFDRIFYPLLAKCNILKKPLQRLVAGAIFVAIAFVISGIVELQLEKTYAKELAKGESSLHFVNSLNCDVKITDVNGIGEDFTVPKLKSFLRDNINFEEYGYNKTFTVADGCGAGAPLTFNLRVNDEEASGFLIYPNTTTGGFSVKRSEYEVLLPKSKKGYPLIRTMYHGFEQINNGDFNGRPTITLYKDEENQHTFWLFNAEGETPPEFEDEELYGYLEVDPAKYQVYVNVTRWNQDTTPPLKGLIRFGDMEPKIGGNYILSVVLKPGTYNDSSSFQDKSNYIIDLHETTQPNTVHMAWLLPQYIVLTMGEIMFSVTIMDFSYAEAPASMKSVMQSAWLLTVAFGNIIVIIVAESQIFKEQWKEFFLFAGLLLADMIAFSYMAYIYEPTKKPETAPVTEKTKEEKE